MADPKQYLTALWETLYKYTFFFFTSFPSVSLSVCLSVCLCLSLKKLYGPFLWMGFNCLMARATSRRQFTFYFFSVSLSLSFSLSLYFITFLSLQVKHVLPRMMIIEHLVWKNLHETWGDILEENPSKHLYRFATYK